MAHAGVEVLIANMMIHSLSPQARRLVEQMYTGNPFKIDIKLDSDSRNRSAEIANTYLKTVGRRMVFIKKKKVIKAPMLRSPFYFTENPNKVPFRVLPESMREGFDYVKDLEERNKLIENAKSPFKFMPVKRDSEGKPIINNKGGE